MHIALIGRARSGKDSVAARLVGQHGYTRVAFADPLKDMALSVNPLVQDDFRLSDVVGYYGWEAAKDRYHEVRGTLQRLGQSIRDVDPDFWLRLALDRVDSASGPVVVSDVRYSNEVAALSARGFRTVRVRRDKIAQQCIGLHVSETALDGYRADVDVFNDGTLPELHARADELI